MCMQVMAAPHLQAKFTDENSTGRETFCYKKKKSSKLVAGLNNYSSYDSRTTSANRNMGTESKHREVAFCLYYIFLIYFSFTASWVLLDVNTSGLNSYSNCAHSLLFFQNLHSAFSYFWWRNPCGGGIKTTNYGEKTALKCHGNLKLKRKPFHNEFLPFSHWYYYIQKRSISFYLLIQDIF